MIRSINIKGQKYKIKIKKCKDEDEYMGLCDTDEKIIYIGAQIEEQSDLYITLVHEIIHAILHETALDQVLPVEVNELIADNIATVIYKEFFSPKGVKRWSKDGRNTNSSKQSK